MIEFHDYDILHPFSVVGEKHVVTGRKIILNYAPLKGSVNIVGYTEDTSLPLVNSSFYIDYDEENNYRAANQIVQFSADPEGKEVIVNYRGVSTLLRAKHLNEITDALQEIRNAILAVAEDSGRETGLPVMIPKPPKNHHKPKKGDFVASDDEYESVINEIFPENG